MDPSTALELAHPLLRRAALGLHDFAAGWILLNGAAHQAGVLWKFHAGTLAHRAELPSLLAIGAGLMVTGAVLSWTLAPLALARSSVLPAVLGLGLLGLVLGLTAARYGFTFLWGSITLGLVDLGVLAAHAVANGR